MEITPTSVLLYQFIRDCAELSARLDQIGTRDGNRLMLAGLIIGRNGYQSLVKRRGDLPATVGNAPLVQMSLDRLLARLKFLEMSL